MALNAEQKQFVEHNGKHLMVIGSAGSGKTHSLIKRVEHLIEKGVDPTRIFLSTFTNASVKEIQERLENDIGFEASLVEVSTLHSWGYRLIREFYSYNNNGGDKYINGKILFDFQLTKHYIDTLKEFDEDFQKAYNPFFFGQEIGKLKRIGLTPNGYEGILRDINDYNDYVASAGDDFVDDLVGIGYKEDILDFYKKSEERHIQNGTCDGDDLILEAYNILNRSSAFRKRIADKYDYILIDEAQDTSKLVHDILEMLKDTVKITLIGDSKQSIYAFNMAMSKMFLSFEERFNADVVALTKNYRSAKAIVEKANMITDQMSFTTPTRDHMEAFIDSDSNISLKMSDTLDEEASWIVRELQARLDNGEDISDTFILHRTNAQVLLIEQALFNNKIPYVNLSKSTILDNAMIAGIVGWLRILKDKKDNNAFKMCYNYPNRFLSKDFLSRVVKKNDQDTLVQTMLAKNFFIKNFEFKQIDDFQVMFQRLYKWFKEGKITEIIEYLYAEGKKKSNKTVVIEGVEVDMNNTPESIGREDVDMIIKSISDNGLDDFIAFTKNVRKKDGDGVVLRTVHSSKGLEAETVYVVGLNGEMFPHVKMMEMRDIPHGYEDFFGHPLEEELNLFYVAVTRAKTNLKLSCPLENANGQRCAPSIFAKYDWS